MFCGVDTENKTEWSPQPQGRNEESLQCSRKSLFSCSEKRALPCQLASWLVDFCAAERLSSERIEFYTVWRRQKIYVFPSCAHAVKRLCNSFSLRKVVILKESSAMLCIVISWFVCYLLNWNDLGNHLIYECMWQLHPNDNNYHYYLNDHCRLEALIFLVSFSISWHWRNALVNTFLQFARARETGDSLRRPNRKPSSFANEESLDPNQAPRINHAQIYDKVW